MTKQEIAIEKNIEFRNTVATLSANKSLKAQVELLLTIYNYEVRQHKSLRHTIEKWVDPAALDKFIRGGIVSIWNKKDGSQDFFVDKDKAQSLYNYLHTARYVNPFEETNHC